MGLFSLFAQAYGDNNEGGLIGQVKKIGIKILFWIIMAGIFIVIFYILYLTQCSKPESGEGTCIMQNENKDFDTFTLDLSSLTAGGLCNDVGLYDNPGQTVDWVDTGYVTNGKQLIVYANGDYYPWGEDQTTKETGYHVMQVQDSNGTFNSVLQIVYAPKECGLNTDIPYSLDDVQETKLIYLNQFNQYTNWNANNRSKNTKGRILYNKGQQADCIAGVNCQFGEDTDEQTSCVLKNGAGIYMKIGNDSTVAYHIKNYFVPEFKEECSTSGYCKLNYKTSNDGSTINLVQIPFALPPVIYNPGYKKDTYMHDIRDDILQNLSIITKTEYETDYKFTTIEVDMETPLEQCDGYRMQVIGGICYKQVEKKMTLSEMQKPRCIYSSTTDINLANELCAPASGNKIWIKPADTCYDDNTGIIKLTFTSGVVSHAKKISYQHDGLKLSFITSFISALFTPFFGSQKDLVDVDDVLYIEKPKDKSEEPDPRVLTICRNDGGVLYIAKLDKDWYIKTEKYGTQGMQLVDVYRKDYTDEFRTSLTMDAKYKQDVRGFNTCIEFSFKKEYNKTTDDIQQKKIIRSNTTLVRVTDIDSGLFVQIRTALMKTPVYNIARIIFVVWFVFSFGIGFLNRQEMLSRVKTISSDWKRFLILLWCSDPNNYDFIDELLWPALFYGSQSVAAGIFDAISGIYGTSITADNPMEFFDEIVTSLTSKELFYKLGAIATSPLSFIMFIFIFPFLISSIKDLLLAIMGPIMSLSFTLFTVGSIITFMPLYAVISLLGSDRFKNIFTKSMKLLISEFIHFAFELGFFGLCIGFCYHYFLQAINIKICWINVVDFKLLWLIPIHLDDWLICNSGAVKQAPIGDRFVILWDMTKNIMKFQIVVMVMGNMSVTIADMLAAIFAKGGGMFGIKKASGLFDSFTNTTKGYLGEYDKDLQKENKEKQKAETMDKKKNMKQRRKNQQQDDNLSNAMQSISRGNEQNISNGTGNQQNNNNNSENGQNKQNKQGEQRVNETQNLNNVESKNNNNKNIEDNETIPRDDGNDNIDIPNNEPNEGGGVLNQSPLSKNKGSGDKGDEDGDLIINRKIINRRRDKGNNAMIQESNAGIQENNAGMQENSRAGIQTNNAGLKDFNAGDNKNNQTEQEQKKIQLEIDKDNKKIQQKERVNKSLEKEKVNIIEMNKKETDQEKIGKNDKMIEQIENIQHNNENIIKQSKGNAYNSTQKLKKLK